MTMTMERPIVATLFSNQDDWDSRTLLEPIVDRLVGLDHSGWRDQFAADGFTHGQVELLDSIVQKWTKQIDKDSLAEKLATVADLEDAALCDEVLVPWMEKISNDELNSSIQQAQFPVPLDAFCYTAGQLGHIIYAALAFEAMARHLQQEPSLDWSMSPEQIEQGVSLAEAGIAEDVKTWPIY